MKKGDILHASCSDTDYQVLAVGLDGNGNDCVSISVPDINDFLDTPHETGEEPNLAYAEPHEAVLHDVQWKDVGDGMVELRTPGNGCYRCTKLFSVKPKP